MAKKRQTKQQEENRETLVAGVTGLILKRMGECQVTPAHLAQRMGKSRRWVNEVLDGKNDNVRALSDVFVTLGRALNFSFVPNSDTAPPIVQFSVAVSCGWEGLLEK